MKPSNRACPVVLLFALLMLGAQVVCAQQDREGEWYLSHINLPEINRQSLADSPIIVAVVDDGVSVSHKDISDFIWERPFETPNNGIDDDGNGYVDDAGGWDVSDGDADVNPPGFRRSEFYHGTYLAGIITRIARAVYGDRASDYIKILPVKSISDQADRLYVADGYLGVEYALNAGADIILTAWGVSQFSNEEERILRRAAERDILVVASAGNFPEGKEQFPAAFDPVLAVAAIDQRNQKINESNYGSFVDLSAPGIGVLSASTVDAESYETRVGSSVAAAIVAAASAIARVEFPDYSAPMIAALLKDGATPIEEVNPEYAAQLGAGSLNLRNALEDPLFERRATDKTATARPQGYVRVTDARSDASTWTISPIGNLLGIRFRLFSSSGGFGQSTVSVFAGVSDSDRLIGRFEMERLPETFFVPATGARVVIERVGFGADAELVLEYWAEPIDVATLYCGGTTILDSEGFIADGSGPNPYSPRSDCKWLINAPEGKVIHIRFVEFDTEPIADKIYFFHGAGTHETIMAIFSGPNIPPELTTWGNQVLMWFVTDTRNQGQGWKAEYRFVDAE